MASIVNETVVTGRKFRRCIDEVNKIWERYSFWHKASDCEFNDGLTAEQKIGDIKGITTRTDMTTLGYAADASIIPRLEQKIKDLEDAFKAYSATIPEDIDFKTMKSQKFGDANGITTPSKTIAAILQIYIKADTATKPCSQGDPGACSDGAGGWYNYYPDCSFDVNIKVDGIIKKTFSAYCTRNPDYFIWQASYGLTVKENQKITVTTSNHKQFAGGGTQYFTPSFLISTKK